MFNLLRAWPAAKLIIFVIIASFPPFQNFENLQVSVAYKTDLLQFSPTEALTHFYSAKFSRNIDRPCRRLRCLQLHETMLHCRRIIVWVMSEGWRSRSPQFVKN